MTVDRATSADRAFLAMDTGGAAEQFGVVLLLDAQPAMDLDRLTRILQERVRAVPRLTRRLVTTPLGCGGPVWVEDARFDLGRHVWVRACPPPGDEPALLAAALGEVRRRLPRDRPLWSAVLMTGLRDGGAALVLVLHHVLADGVGGLTLLGALVDPGPGAITWTPAPEPTRRALAHDAARARLRALRRVPRAAAALGTSMQAAGGVRPPAATPSTLTRPTGTRRAVAGVHASLSDVRSAAHAVGATTNDAVLVAVASALHDLLRTRGEDLRELVVAVPVSGRAAPGTDEAGRGDSSGLGNLVSPLLVTVPISGDLGARLAEVARQVRAGRRAASGPAPIAVLGWLFRPLARMGAFRWYMRRQRRFHTLVSHVRGPEQPVSLAGTRVRGAIPVAVGEPGNMTVWFEVLSYAGRLTVCVIVDPELLPELDLLTQRLGFWLGELSGRATPG